MSQQVPVQQPVFGFSNLAQPPSGTTALPQQPPQPGQPQQPALPQQVPGAFPSAGQMMFPAQGAYTAQPFMVQSQYGMTPMMQQPVQQQGAMMLPQARMGTAMMMPPVTQATQPLPGMAPVQPQAPTSATALLPVVSGVSQAAMSQPLKYSEGEDDDDEDTDGDDEGGSKKKRPRTNRKMTEEQKVERRERNREHAKRSRVRKKFLLESLQKSVNALQEENDKLRSAIRTHLGEATAEELMKDCAVEPTDSLITADPNSATKILEDPDYTLVKALQTAQQNFVITDPSLPDNPIVYASQGFLNLTGYSMEQILGRNCRFLQGPETDPEAVDKIRKAIEEGMDGSVCLVNYREDGTTFWNQFFIAALRGADGSIVNYVGVQCKVSEEYAKEVLKAEKEKKGQPAGQMEEAKRAIAAALSSANSVGSAATAPPSN